jgi:hypothetical protein
MRSMVVIPLHNNHATAPAHEAGQSPNPVGYAIVPLENTNALHFAHISVPVSVWLTPVVGRQSERKAFLSFRVGPFFSTITELGRISKLR